MLSSISINKAWSFLGIKLFATVEANDCMLIFVLIELVEVLTSDEFFGGIWCSGLGFDVIFSEFGLGKLLGVNDDVLFFCFCTYNWIAENWWFFP